MERERERGLRDRERDEGGRERGMRDKERDEGKSEEGMERAREGRNNSGRE